MIKPIEKHFRVRRSPAAHLPFLHLFLQRLSLVSINTNRTTNCSMKNNKTGTRRCTWAVWSTFAEIHSTHWNFRLEFVTHTSQHTRDLPNLSYDCDLWIHLVFRLLLVLFRLVDLSVEAKDDTAFIGFPFALVFTWTFTECVTYITNCMSSTAIIMNNFGRLLDILWNEFSS